MLILGFNCSRVGHLESPLAHDAAAALVDDDSIIACAEEERFSRRKHTGMFPANAIRYCLREAGATLSDVDRFCFHWDPDYDRHNMVTADVPTLDIIDRHSWRLPVRAEIFDNFKRLLDFEVPPEKRRFVRHHLCHAASSFFCSPFEQAAFLVIDAYGEMNSITAGTVDDRGFAVLQSSLLPTSLGVFFNSLTRLLGFFGRDDEYKVMGLAAYGNPERFRRCFQVQWQATNAGVTLLDTVESRRAALELTAFRRMPTDSVTQDHMDIAAALQESTEDQILHLARRLRATTNETHLCLSGGVAQNSSANGKLVRDGLFDRVFIQPAAHDAGAALGAALFERATISPRREPVRRRRFTPFLGPEFTQDEINAACDSYSPEIVVSTSANLFTQVATALAAGKLVAWFQGRMEFGPRALGARSILADPRERATRDRVNATVKHREPFRPFAPAVLAEKATLFFDVTDAIDLSLMVCTVPVKMESRDRIPAVVHQDGTARIQAVASDVNPKLWALLRAFDEITGIPVLLNTSFNVNGEPIVCTPAQAIECFLSTSLDLLVLGDTIVERRSTEHPRWCGAYPTVQEGTEITTTFAPPLPDESELRRTVAVTRRHASATLEPAALDLLLECDGTRSVEDLIALFVDATGETVSTVRSVTRLLTTLLSLRVIKLMDSPVGDRQ